MRDLTYSFYVFHNYSVSDAVELLPGVLTEKPVKNALLGPTLACMAVLQFENIKNGDRFWYTNNNLDSSFSLGNEKLLYELVIISICTI